MTRHTISLFNRKNDATPKEQAVTWEDLLESIRNPLVRTKKDGALSSPARFSPAHRLKANVVEVCWLPLDLDHDADIDADLSVWQRQGVRVVAYTSHSHLRVTDENPK